MWRLHFTAMYKVADINRLRNGCTYPLASCSITKLPPTVLALWNVIASVGKRESCHYGAEGPKHICLCLFKDGLWMVPFIGLSDDRNVALRFVVCHGSEFSSVYLCNYVWAVRPGKGSDNDSKLATTLLSQILSKPICTSAFPLCIQH